MTMATTTIRTTHVLTIPGWLPLTLNQLLRLHWAARGRALRREARLVATAAIVAGVPRSSGKRLVTQRLTLAGRDRVRDHDNAWKGVLDHLVKAGLLVDDSPRWCEVAPLEQVRGKARMTEILLEDLT